jgi:hypothetical protein
MDFSGRAGGGHHADTVMRVTAAHLTSDPAAGLLAAGLLYRHVHLCYDFLNKCNKV